LGSLVRASARAREGEGELVLSAPSRFVRTIVRQVGLDRLLRVFPDDESALRHLCPPRTAAGGCTQGGLHVAVS
jgi:anti-anti-sigma regulatory factor